MRRRHALIAYVDRSLQAAQRAKNLPKSPNEVPPCLKHELAIFVQLSSDHINVTHDSIIANRIRW